MAPWIDTHSSSMVCMRVFSFLGNELGRVPTRAAVNHVEDDVLVDEKKIAAELSVERV
jgi:hypothetical protein